MSIIPFVLKKVIMWYQKANFVNNSGLLLHYNNITEMEGSNEFKNYIKNLGEIKVLKILGLTGKDTFVSKKSFLREIFDSHIDKNSVETIQILLSDVNNEFLKNRAETLKLDINRYKKEIEESKDFLEKHPKLSEKINLKFYNFKPNCKIIIIDNLLLLQGYIGTSHVNNEQVYGFINSENTSIYKVMKIFFDETFDKL